MKINQKKIRNFTQTIWRYYRLRGRHAMAWRHTRDPYKILVSEVMLQQTQVSRVEAFYPKFLRAFPNINTLARTPLKRVLKVWQGMGYNRRAVALHRLAQEVVKKYKGKLPNRMEALIALPGIGKATAGAIMAYAFNQPVAFIETNVRRVFINEFFPKATTVDDKEIMQLVERILDRRNPREWYWALMDYGAFLATQIENPNRKSDKYRKQSKFEGSIRQLRGAVLKVITRDGAVGLHALMAKLAIQRSEKEVQTVLRKLEMEKFIVQVRGKWQIGGSSLK